MADKAARPSFDDDWESRNAAQQIVDAEREKLEIVNRTKKGKRIAKHLQRWKKAANAAASGLGKKLMARA